MRQWKWMLPFLLVAVVVTAQSQQPASDEVYQAVRTNNLSALRALGPANGLNAQDRQGNTPLMLAAAFGSFEAVQLLIDRGADVNTPAASGITPLHVAVRDPRKVRLLLSRGAKVNVTSLALSTPLIVAASTAGASESVKQLLDRGADVNLADRNGVTALIGATLVNDSASAEMLLQAGANVSVRANAGLGAPLVAAAENGNAKLARLLLDRKADVNAASNDYAAVVKNGQVHFGRVTPLHTSVSGHNAAVTKLLLDSGAKVDALDIRGMTPLMVAVGTDHPDPEIIKLLRAHGADPSLKSGIGESALDWARKFNNPVVVREFGLQPGAVVETDRGSAPTVMPAANRPIAETTPSARVAVERSLPLLRTTSARMQTDGGCVACHAQPLTAMASTLADARGWRAGGPPTASTQQTVALSGMIPNLLQPIFQGGAPDGQTYGGLMLAVEKTQPNLTTDALVYYLAAIQHTEGYWHGAGATRAPMQDGDIARTAFSIRVLAAFATPALKDDFAGRIARAVRWLNQQTPTTTSDQAMQLLGLVWGQADAASLERRAKALVAVQRDNGGWAQTPNLPADAYGTGQAVYALSESGIAVPGAVISRGAAFLLQTQHADGSWHVVNRAMKIQPYFDSGFPYDHDQWISHAATAWAAMALCVVPEPTLVAQR